MNTRLTHSASITTRRLLACLFCLFSMAGYSVADDSVSNRETGIDYPDSPRVDQVDDYHGTQVADPYRWLEDLQSPETRAWIEAQNKVTFAWLEQIPQRDALKKRLTELWDYERIGVPVKGGDRYFYLRNDGLQNQSVLYVTDSPDSEPRVLLDPNTVLADGTAALAAWIPSEDGKLLAYGLQEAGSDWEQWKIRNIETGEDFPEELKGVKWAAVAWAK
ncbi:MAG TPA: hypothetical protein VJN01_02175, partial [Xanthomonadales bacterium]|nr:hypothetical protein [Xanthomonadales bacterium]